MDVSLLCFLFASCVLIGCWTGIQPRNTNRWKQKSSEKSVLPLAKEARKEKPNKTENFETVIVLFQTHTIEKLQEPFPTTIHTQQPSTLPLGCYQRSPSRLSILPGINNLLSVKNV